MSKHFRYVWLLDDGELLLDMRNISKPDVYLKITVSLGHYWWADSGTYLVQMDLTGNDNLTIYQPSNPRISGTNLLTVFSS